MEAEFKKAVNLFEIDKIKQAKKICIKIYKKNPKHFDNLRLLNFIYFKEKNFYEALNIINEAIKINPNFAEAYSEQGNALNELKQLNMALKSYDNAIKINPNFSNAYYNKAVVLHELKNMDSTEQDMIQWVDELDKNRTKNPFDETVANAMSNHNVSMEIKKNS